jgi:hypothetical protein
MIKLKSKWKKDEGALALLRLLKLCHVQVDDSTLPIIDFLCGCYYGSKYKPHMQLLCKRIDTVHFQDVLKVMILIHRTGLDAHDFIEFGRPIFMELSNITLPCRRVER